MTKNKSIVTERERCGASQDRQHIRHRKPLIKEVIILSLISMILQLFSSCTPSPVQEVRDGDGMVNYRGKAERYLVGHWESSAGDWSADLGEESIVITLDGTVVLDDIYRLNEYHSGAGWDLTLTRKELSKDGVTIGRVEDDMLYLTGQEDGDLRMEMVLPGGGKDVIEFIRKDTPSDESITKTAEHAFVTARLENNALSITISEEKFRAAYGNLEKAPEFGKPYAAAGMKTGYKDMIVGSLGNAVNPYVFLLAKDGTVECVPVADQIVAGEGFTNVGKMTGLSDIVSFKEGSVIGEEGWGYHTIFAVSSDGKEHDLVEVWAEMTGIPEMTAPSGEEAIKLLSAEPSADELIKSGLSMTVTEDFEFLYGEVCCCISLDDNSGDNPVRVVFYAVSSSGAIYLYDIIGDKWTPVNAAALTYAYGWQDNSMFAVLTDPNTEEYKGLRAGAEEISTPAISEQEADVVLLVPMHSGISFSIELPSGGSQADKVIKTIENAKRGECYAVKVSLGSDVAPLHIFAKYDDEPFSGYTAQWDAVRSEKGGEKGIEYFNSGRG